MGLGQRGLVLSVREIRETRLGKHGTIEVMRGELGSTFLSPLGWRKLVRWEQGGISKQYMQVPL